MKKELLISKMAILLFFCVFLFNATAQAQCIFYQTEKECTMYPDCKWCPTTLNCYGSGSTCATCQELTNLQCVRAEAVCHWCGGINTCFPNERPCPPYCGNGILEPGEQCDSTPHCTANCNCASGYIPDPQNPGYCKAAQVCGNGILEGTEQCEFGQYCVDCQCQSPAVPDLVNLGYCIAPNNPPVLDPIGNKQIDEGQTLQFTITASDPDGNALTYSASNLPNGANFDPLTQTFTWTPGYDQEGSYQNVLFTVTDNGTPMASDFEAITITVGNVNRPPVLDPIGNKQAYEGQTLQFTITASDPDEDGLVYSASNLPSGANFDPLTRTFTWTPGYGQAGSYQNVLFTVTDNWVLPLSASEAITITVGDVNRPPALDPIGDKTVTEGETLTFPITATDPDYDPLIYSAGNLPPGAGFINQIFSWTPDYTQAGTYPGVHFEVTDGSLTDFKEITITVNNVILQATIDINPETLNLKSKGGENSMTAYIELPGGYDVRQISVASIRLNVNGKMISPQPVPTSIGDYDGDGLYDLMVKFDRQAVISALGGRTGDISLTVTGKLNNGPEFTGSDTIKVINPGK